MLYVINRVFSLSNMQKQLDTKNSKRNQSRPDDNGGVKGRDSSTEVLDRYTGEEQPT